LFYLYLVAPAKAGAQSIRLLDSLPSRFARQYMSGGEAAGRGNDDYFLTGAAIPSQAAMAASTVASNCFFVAPSRAWIDMPCTSVA